MKKYRKLSIRGTLLDRNQLCKYIEKVADEHNVKTSSDENTYPIKTLHENYEFILETYRLLNKHIKLGIKIHSAGEWLLDNFYIIEENVKSIEKDMPLKKYKAMPGLSNGRFQGFARCYVLAEEIIAYTDCKIDKEIIDIALKAYQNKKFLGMDEICNLGVFLKISIISHIRDVCEKIYSSQIQKYKVESIVERIIEKKDVNEQKFINTSNVKVFSDTELKYPFIEYMSYKLKLYGKKAVDYQNVLEKEVQKLGVNLSDVIQKEHLYIANLKIKMGNCIISIKSINRINFAELFSYINISEEILENDPAGEYLYMDQESKAFYRGIISEISKKSKISEIYICEKIVELCNRYRDYKNIEEKKKAHVGYYLFDKGKIELEDILEIKHSNKNSTEFRVRFYISSTIILPILIDLFSVTFFYVKFRNVFVSLLLLILLYIPISEMFLRTLNYILGKIKKPTQLPKLNFESGIPEDKATFVVIPTILKSKDKVKEMIDKLEIYYLANKSENLYFALLGDCSEEKQERVNHDDEVIEFGEKYIEELNQKYQNIGFNKFHFLYRKRIWNECEKSFIGWERKRGLLVTFNKYIKGLLKNEFLSNSIEKQKSILPIIKYIITLDSDTNLCLGTAQKLIGAMSHVLNLPIIKNRQVVDGYGIMQPRIGVDLELTKKTKFIELYSIHGGIDFYTNAISDIYQDYFKEGIFTGKGIYDVDVYNEILDGEIEENTVLSHDLLEGNFLRCGLLTDVMLIDGYPLKYIPYILRNHRWIRGDWQIKKWLKSRRLNKISKYKIYDNLRRSLVSPIAIFGIIFGTICNLVGEKSGNLVIVLSFISILISYILDIVNYIVFKESTVTGSVYTHKKFSNDLRNWVISLYRIWLTVLFLPYEALNNIDSICKSLYRMRHKTKLLEWVTAEDGEKNSKSDLKSYFLEMRANVFLGIIFLASLDVFTSFIGILWIIAPAIAWKISLENNKRLDISEKNKKYLRDIGNLTWNFFEDNINEQNHYLMIDNFQEDRKIKVVNRTSSTNIGLEYIAIISAYDLEYITKEKAIDYIKKLTETINSLVKWNGHLYNWYNTLTLEPLIPRYISTVDSGNFIGYLYIVKQFLIECNDESLEYLIKNISDLIDNTDFSVLYSEENKLMSIGFNLEENKLTDSYYDFLASEARQASLVAIAKGDVPSKHWNNFSRILTTLDGYKGLISWTGTAFEYLMPNINFKRYEGSLLDESSKFAIYSQIEYCKKLNVPWGISESAYNLRDLNNNYQYKAFGIPWLGLKRGLEDDIVISPYSTFLALEDVSFEGIKNLKYLEKEGAKGKYGFYESIDYTGSRLKDGRKNEVIKTFMAHHQGLILLSINNMVNSNILKKRFNKNPEIEAVNILLQEKMPVQMIITKEKKEKISKTKVFFDSGYIERSIENPNRSFKNVNVISNENYKITINDLGESISEYKGKMINNYKSTSELKQGIFFYVRNVKTKKIKRIEECEKVIFTPDRVKFIGREVNLKFELTVILDPNRCIEIRNLKIENFGQSEEVLEIICELEPCLSVPRAEYSHPAFNKMFLRFEAENDDIIVKRISRNLDEELYLATTLDTDENQLLNFEFELDKEKYYGRENYEIPNMIKEQKSFSNDVIQAINPIIAMKRTIKVNPNVESNVSLILAVGETKDEVKKLIQSAKGNDEINKILNIAKARAEEQSKFLQIKSDKLEMYYKLLSYILNLNFEKSLNLNLECSINGLWKYGISGDLPIITLRISKLEEVYVLEDIIRAFEYYRIKNIYMDLVIFNNENNIYEKFVEDGINSIISERQIDYLKNISGGIFILNEKKINKDEFQSIILKSRIFIDAKNGNLNSFLKEIDEGKIKEKSEILKQKILENNQEIIPLKKDELLFDNGFGGFTNTGKEYFIYKDLENKLPAVWCNILANNSFGTVVTDNFGGYIWDKNSRLNRLTAWNNDQVNDLPSEIYYIKDESNNSYWTLNSSVAPNKNYYYVRHGFGYTNFQNSNDNLIQNIDIFVPIDDSLKILNFRFKNIINENRNIKLLIYIKPVLGEDEIFTNGNISVEKENENTILIKNAFADENFKNKIMYIFSSEKICNFTGDKNDFFGNGNLIKPDGLFKMLNNSSGLGKESCIGIEIKFSIEKLASKEFFIQIGNVQNLEQINKITQKYVNENFVNNKLDEVKNKWNNILNIVNVKTPSDSINLMMNGWLVYQTISSRIFSKTGYYQSGRCIWV